MCWSQCNDLIWYDQIICYECWLIKLFMNRQKFWCWLHSLHITEQFIMHSIFKSNWSTSQHQPSSILLGIFTLKFSQDYSFQISHDLNSKICVPRGSKIIFFQGFNFGRLKNKRLGKWQLDSQYFLSFRLVEKLQEGRKSPSPRLKIHLRGN